MLANRSNMQYHRYLTSKQECMGRIIGIDFGMARIGLSRSDESKILASPFATIKAQKKSEDTIALILAEIKDFTCSLFVIGLPLQLSGNDSPMSEMAKAFGEKLKELSGIEIAYLDERLTSKQVERSMIDSGVNRKKRAKNVDTLSATLILQSYLDMH